MTGRRKRCNNSLYIIGTDLPEVKCLRKLSVVLQQGTPWELALCDDCANGEQRLMLKAMRLLEIRQESGA